MKKPTLNQTPSQSIYPRADEPLTIPELAQLFRVSKNYFYELSRKGNLPCSRMGKNIRIFPEHVARIKEMFDSPILSANGEAGDR